MSSDNPLCDSYLQQGGLQLTILPTTTKSQVSCFPLFLLLQSSLLMALLGELPALSGAVTLSGRVAYASQQPWVFGATVRENITFGKPYDAKKFENIVRVCSLTKVLIFIYLNAFEVK